MLRTRLVANIDQVVDVLRPGQVDPGVVSDIGMKDSAKGRLRELRLVKAEGGQMRAPGRVSPDASPGWSGVAGSLPYPISSFVGRVTELERLGHLLASHRLLTLTGSGGCGKTRLAVELARRHDTQYSQGAWFVDLASVSGEDFVLTEIAAVLGVEEPERGRTLAEATVGRLRTGSFLIVLDNCEHVISAASSAAAALLQGAAGLVILATSREPLGVPGEVTWRVPELSSHDALELFTERARQARPGARPSPAQPAVIRGICEQLDNLPLAIELAAARSRVLSPARIASVLSQRFELLASTAKGGPSRQATLRASFAWSYDLLPGSERELLAQLAVFVGGFGLEDVLAVCPGTPVSAVASLADRSLLVLDGEQSSEPRYRMLESVREFAADCLAEQSGDATETRRRHCEHYLAMAEAAELELTHHGQDEWVSRLATDYGNLRAALAWCRDLPDPAMLARLAVALTPYWLEHSQWSECRLWLEATSGTGPLPGALRAQVLNRRCYLELWAGDAATVPDLAKEALALLAGVGDAVEEGRAHGFLGLVIAIGIGPEAARPQMQRALELTRQGGDDWGLAMGLAFFADTRLFQADPEQARRMLDESIEIATSAGDRRTLRHALAMAALAAITQGRIDEAVRRAQRAAHSAGQAGHGRVVIRALFVQAWALLLQGDPGAAASMAQDIRAAAQESGEEGQGLALWLQASAALAEADPPRAIALLNDGCELPEIDGMLSALPVLTLAEALLAAGDRHAAEATADHAAAMANATGRAWILGRVYLLRARLAEDLITAESHVLEGIALARDAGDALALVDAVDLLAALAAERGDDAEAVRLWAAASAARARLGCTLSAATAAARQERLALVLGGASPDRTASAWAEGEQLSVEEAIAYASRGRGRRKRPATGWPSLTPAEVDVVRLVARHLSNPEIAERLFISRATVKTHLIHAFAKLGIRSRSELAAEAIKRGLG